MLSSVAKGRKLELAVVKKLRDAGIEHEHTGGPVDKGIDIKGVVAASRSLFDARIGTEQ
ncbi:3547_t:CDS:2, partial [Entrophospora sp. SA101]